MLTDEQISKIATTYSGLKRGDDIAENLVKDMIREALELNDKEWEIKTGTIPSGQRLHATPRCTLPFKEGEYAPEFDVAIGEWVYPKYKRCPECEKLKQELEASQRQNEGLNYRHLEMTQALVKAVNR